jgi:hypothetical protein
VPCDFSLTERLPSPVSAVTGWMNPGIKGLASIEKSNNID